MKINFRKETNEQRKIKWFWRKDSEERNVIQFDADIEPHEFFSQESPDSAEAERMFVKYFFLQIPMENPGLNWWYVDSGLIMIVLDQSLIHGSGTSGSGWSYYHFSFRIYLISLMLMSIFVIAMIVYAYILYKFLFDFILLIEIFDRKLFYPRKNAYD